MGLNFYTFFAFYFLFNILNLDKLVLLPCLNHQPTHLSFIPWGSWLSISWKFFKLKYLNLEKIYKLLSYIKLVILIQGKLWSKKSVITYRQLFTFFYLYINVIVSIYNNYKIVFSIKCSLLITVLSFYGYSLHLS